MTVAVDGLIETVMPWPYSSRRADDVFGGVPGLTTVRFPLPDSVKLLFTRNFDDDTKVVVIDTPLSFAVAPATKYRPWTSNVVGPRGTIRGENH